MVIPKAAQRLRPVSFAAGVLAVVALFWLRWSGVSSGSWADLEVYVRGAQSILTGTPLYKPQAGILPFTYPPFAAVVFTPLHLLSTTGARLVFTLGSLISYLVVLGAFGWRMVLVSRRQWVRAWLLGAVFAAGAKWGVTLQPSQESLTLLQQVACATYVAAGTGLLSMWAFGSGGGGPAARPLPRRTISTANRAGAAVVAQITEAVHPILERPVPDDSRAQR